MPRGDPLSEALRLVRVDTTIVFRARFGAPWGLGIEEHFGPAFYILTGGSCYLQIDRQPGQQRLSAGDLVMLPTGQRHWLRDHPSTPVSTLEQILACAAAGGDGPARVGGDGAPTWMVCGGFTAQGWRAHPIAPLLPGRRATAAGRQT
jgi:hypothetical protein